MNSYDRHSRVALFGIPIDNLTFEEILIEMLQLVRNSKDDYNHYISTVNVDFLTQSLSAFPLSERNPVQANPEVVKILRRSRLTTADGMPLIWLSRLLGSSIKQRITGADLVPAISEKLAEHHGSIYLLGGDPKNAKVASAVLQALYPGLNISGRSSPNISVQGESLEYTSEIDSQVVYEINQTNTDILMVNLGHPKQEIWFERVKNKIKVPVAIGVGGTLDFISGAKPRAPKWVQKIGFEWFYRLIIEPKRLWKRYLYGGVKLLTMSLPVIAFHNLNRLVVKIAGVFETRKAAKNFKPTPLLFVSQNTTLAMLTLPKILDATFAAAASRVLDDSLGQDALSLDFQHTTHITLEGFAFLIDLCNQSQALSHPLWSLNISYRLRLLMRFHRVWDLILPTYCQSVPDFYERTRGPNESRSLFLSLEQNENSAELHLFGPIVDFEDNPPLLDRIYPILRGKQCRLNLSLITEIDNPGFSFLLRLGHGLKKEGSSLSWIVESKQIRNSIRNCNLETFFFAN